MSGHIISRPEPVHQCAPGWTYSVVSATSTAIGPRPGDRIAHPPGTHDYPAGTVWQCDCGRTWVSTGPLADNTPGLADFRLERRRERRKRERATA